MYTFTYTHMCIYIHVYTCMSVEKGSRQTTLRHLRYYGVITICVGRGSRTKDVL